MRERRLQKQTCPSREPSLTEITEAIKLAVPIIEGKRDDSELTELPPIYREKMGLDLYDAAKMDQRQARWTVDMFYILQDSRKRAQGQRRAMDASQEPNRMLDTAYRMTAQLERNLNSALFVYAQSRKVGRWMMSLPGIAHVLAAGFLAYIDITKVRSVSQIWRFAGLDPSLVWYGKKKAKAIMTQLLEKYGGPGAVTDAHGIVKAEFLACVCQETSRKPDRLAQMALFGGKHATVKLDNLEKALAQRPWNARLRTHCWKLGECLHKNNSNPHNTYAPVMAERRLLDNARSEQGLLAEQAEAALKDRKPGRATVAYGKYKKGLLPDGHLHSRAKRYGVKLFLSHLFQVMYEDHYGEKPENPWVFEYGSEGHCHLIPPPNWPLEEA